MKHSIVKRAISVAHRSVAIALFGAFLLAVAGMIAQSMFDNWSRRIDARLQNANHVASQVFLLTERLSTLAQKAIASDDSRWTVRYENAAPQFARAIGEAIAMAPSEAVTRYNIYGKVASDAAIGMERDAMLLAKKKNKTAAEAIMNSRLYASQQAIFAGEANRLVEATRHRLQSDFAAVSDFSQPAKFYLVLIGIGVLWVALYRNLRRSENVFAEAEDNIRFLAMHDDLTGLSNRRAFGEALSERLREVVEASRKLALISIDMVGFKRVNGLYGHIIGDAVLAALARRLRATESDHTNAFCVGGDEFLILTEFSGKHDLAAQCNRLIDDLKRPIAAAAGITVALSARLGVATAPDDANDPQSLYRKADIALQQARSEETEAAIYYNGSMDERIQSRAKIESELPAAIKRGFIVPYYQPVIELGSGSLVGFEALARWEHPDEGLIAPDAFISIAEDAGLIDDLFFSILRQACATALLWPNYVTVSVNLSPTQLSNPDISTRIRDIVNEAGIAPERLEIEITEDALATNFSSVRRPLLQLRELGVSIALDDFGTGYSSMQHLAELLVNKIKIDKSFIHPSAARQSTKVVKSMLGLARSLGMKTTAEGIEHETQALELREAGCVYGQGYLYSKPVNRLACLNLLETCDRFTNRPKLRELN